MKKTYIVPATTVTKLAIHNMLCLSGQLDKSHNITNSSDFGARDNNSWDIWGNNDDLED